MREQEKKLLHNDYASKRERAAAAHSKAKKMEVEKKKNKKAIKEAKAIKHVARTMVAFRHSTSVSSISAATPR